LRTWASLTAASERGGFAIYASETSIAQPNQPTTAAAAEGSPISAKNPRIRPGIPARRLFPDGGSSSSRRGALVAARRRRALAAAWDSRCYLAPLRPEARCRRRQGSWTAAAHLQKARRRREGGVVVAVGAGVAAAAAVVVDRAAPDGVAGGAVPLADPGHAPAPASRRRRAAARAAPDRPRRRQGQRRRQARAVGRRHRAVQVYTSFFCLFVCSFAMVASLSFPVGLAVIKIRFGKIDYSKLSPCILSARVIQTVT
jgi:hypothetical protein